jgi:hypothetical protein
MVGSDDYCAVSGMLNPGDASRLLTGRDDDNQYQNDDARNEAHAHLHVLLPDKAVSLHALNQGSWPGCQTHLPPHLLANAIRAATEAVGRCREIVGLVLQSVKPLASLRNFVDVLPHNANSVIDLLQKHAVSSLHRYNTRIDSR